MSITPGNFLALLTEDTSVVGSDRVWNLWEFYLELKANAKGETFKRSGVLPGRSWRYKKFDALVRWLDSVGINPRDWLRAQFEEWGGPRGGPQVTQLTSDGARHRYLRWLRRRVKATAGNEPLGEKPTTAYEVFLQELEDGRRKLLQMRGRVGDPVAFLSVAPGAFPPAFWLVWPSIQAEAKRNQLPVLVMTRWQYACQDERARKALDNMRRELVL